MSIETGTADPDVIDLSEYADRQGEAAPIAGGIAIRDGLQVKLRANELGQGFYYGGSYFSEDDAANQARMTDAENPLPPYHQAMYEKYYGQRTVTSSGIVDNVRNILSRSNKEGE